MKTLYDLEVGDRVQIFEPYRRNGKSGGEDGVVTKKGRLLITVTHVGYDRGVQYRMENGRANDGYGHSYIRTPEQAAESIHRSELQSRLFELGIRFDLGVRPSSTKLEALIKVMEETE